jgi:hypothetical protein
MNLIVSTAYIAAKKLWIQMSVLIVEMFKYFLSVKENENNSGK